MVKRQPPEPTQTQLVQSAVRTSLKMSPWSIDSASRRQRLSVAKKRKDSHVSNRPSASWARPWISSAPASSAGEVSQKDMSLLARSEASSVFRRHSDVMAHISASLVSTHRQRLLGAGSVAVCTGARSQPHLSQDCQTYGTVAAIVAWPIASEYGGCYRAAEGSCGWEHAADHLG